MYICICIFVFVDCPVHISGKSGWLTIPATHTDNSNRPTAHSSLFQKIQRFLRRHYLATKTLFEVYHKSKYPWETNSQLSMKTSIKHLHLRKKASCLGIEDLKKGVWFHSLFLTLLKSHCLKRPTFGIWQNPINVPHWKWVREDGHLMINLLKLNPVYISLFVSWVAQKVVKTSDRCSHTLPLDGLVMHYL